MILIALMIAAASDASRCEAGFGQFVTRYADDLRYQRSRAAPLLRYSFVVDGGLGEPRHITRAVRPGASRDWQMLSSRQRAAKGLELVLRSARGRAEAMVRSPDSDSYQIVYRFARRDGCWQLYEVDNQSL